MLELFAGVSLAFLLYSFLEEWRQRRLNKIQLIEMRHNFKVGRRWDVAKGQWSDN
jgi:peptidoglycan/LPS O-acetylase OafA/YrhL